jgi:hypothetical protein
MPSTYTRNLLLQQPATGEQAGTWGITANNDFAYLDNAIDGNIYIALSSSTYALNTAQDTESPGRNKVIVWTGTLTAVATVNITPPTAQKFYIMTNSTTGGFAINFQQGSGGGGIFTLNAGSSAIIFADGAGQTARVTGALYNVQLGSVLVQTALTVNGPLTATGAATFTGSALTVQNFVINQPGFASAPYDIYYRHPNGPLVPLPIGAPGQVLQAQAGPNIAWATVQLSIGSPIAGSVANSVYYADGAGRLAQYNQININGNGLAIGAGASAGPSHTLQLGPVLNPEIFLNASDSTVQQRQLVFSSNLVARWIMFTPLTPGEGGGNSGSDFGLLACADNGAGSRWALYCVRSSGNVTIGISLEQGNRLGVFADNPAQYVLRVRGANGQSAHLQTWENNGGGVLAYVNSAGQINCGGYLVNGSPLPTGSPQTPWASDINANLHSLTNCSYVGGTNNNGAGVLMINESSGTGPPVNRSIYFYVVSNSLWASVRLSSGAILQLQLSS